MSIRETLVAPLVDRNPVTLQVLGVCSALAITNSVYTSLVMGAALTSVLAFSNAYPGSGLLPESGPNTPKPDPS